MKPLIFEEEAESEFNISVAFYEERLAGLGLDFETAVRDALGKIADAPDRWPMTKQGTRRYIMTRFPFIIHYLRSARQTLGNCIRTREAETGLLETKVTTNPQ